MKGKAQAIVRDIIERQDGAFLRSIMKHKTTANTPREKMKITNITEDPKDPKTSIIEYQLTEEELKMLIKRSKETGKTTDELITEGFANSAKNFK